MYDIIAIGDTVTDAFIRLKEATTNKEHSTLTLRFGDKVPYESVEEVVAVGNSANAAVSAARLGLKTALVSNLGADEHGRKAKEYLGGQNVALDFIAQHEGMKTNYHYVLWFEEDRTILVKHEDYPYQFPNISPTKWIYVSSLAQGTLEYHQAIAQYLKAHPEVKCAFQPGTFQLKFGVEKLKDLYTRTEIFFCNVQEAEIVLDINTLGVEELLKRIHALGPKIVVITDGPKGAYAYDGEKMYQQAPYPDPKPPLDRTGAGDAFASTTVAAIALGKDLQTALSWGAVNSMSVVQEVGAQKGLLKREELEKYLK